MVEGGGEGDADIGESDPEDLLESAQGDSADDSPVPDVPTTRRSGASGETVVVAMPEMGESVTEGTVLEWAVAVGDSVAEGDTVVEVSTDKVDAEVPAPAAGTITKLLVEPDEVVKVGQPLAEMAAGAAATAGVRPPRPAQEARRFQRAADGSGAAPSRSVSPVAQRMAADRGIDVGSIQGSGEGGKVLKADVLAAADGERRRACAGGRRG